MPLQLSYPVADPVIIQPFGVNWTGDPTFYAAYGLPAHEGVDFKAPTGTPVLACAAGILTRLERVPSGAYGIQVRIEHIAQDGVFETVYAHLQSIKETLTVGGSVTRGQEIGLSDNTGHSTGAHLHLTLKKRGATERGEKQRLGNGTWVVYPSDVVNPTPYLE